MLDNRTNSRFDDDDDDDGVARGNAVKQLAQEINTQTA
jgi:uncharacterized protein YoaH (UPF0181 family)